jgi:hypothetical protein
MKSSNKKVTPSGAQFLGDALGVLFKLFGSVFRRTYTFITLFCKHFLSTWIQGTPDELDDDILYGPMKVHENDMLYGGKLP